MRAYLTGVTSTSIWTHYSKGGRTFCGHELPEGMKKNQRSAEGDPDAVDEGREGLAHDESAVVARADPRDGRARRGRLRPRRRDVRARVRVRPAGGAAPRAHPVVDTKYEIGGRPRRDARFIDEIHTPDSSRYWYAGLRRALRARRGAARPRQGVRAPHARRPGIRATAPRPSWPTTSASRRRAATSRSASCDRPPLRPNTDTEESRPRASAGT